MKTATIACIIGLPLACWIAAATLWSEPWLYLAIALTMGSLVSVVSWLCDYKKQLNESLNLRSNVQFDDLQNEIGLGAMALSVMVPAASCHWFGASVWWLALVIPAVFAGVCWVDKAFPASDFALRRARTIRDRLESDDASIAFQDPFEPSGWSQPRR